MLFADKGGAVQLHREVAPLKSQPRQASRGAVTAMAAAVSAPEGEARRLLSFTITYFAKYNPSIVGGKRKSLAVGCSIIYALLLSRKKTAYAQSNMHCDIPKESLL